MNVSPRSNYIDGVNQILSMPRARVYRNGGYVVAGTTDTLIPWDVMDYDNDGLWNPNTPTRLTCRTAGLYRSTGWCQWPANGGSLRSMRLRVNGGAKFDGPIESIYDPGGGGPINNYSSVDFPLNAGDYVEMLVNQTGVALAFNAATAGSWVNGLQLTCLSLP